MGSRLQAARSCAVALLAACAAGAASAQGGDAPRVVKEQRFASWGYSCAVAGNGKGAEVERCMISQMVATNPRERKVVLGLTVDFEDSRTVPTLRARFSADAKREAGIGIKIDEKPEMRLAIGDCNTQRCESLGRMSTPVLKAWSSGKIGKFAFLRQSGKQVLLPISLDGFDQALAALRQHPGGSVAPPAKTPART